jgi:hypothetical protein
MHWCATPLRLSNAHSFNKFLPAAYPDAQLGKKNLGLGSVLVSHGGSFVYRFDVPMSYQAIKGLLFGSARIFDVHPEDTLPCILVSNM